MSPWEKFHTQAIILEKEGTPYGGHPDRQGPSYAILEGTEASSYTDAMSSQTPEVLFALLTGQRGSG